MRARPGCWIYARRGHAHGSLRAGAARKTKDARQLNWIYAESCHTSLFIIRIFSGFVKALFLKNSLGTFTDGRPDGILIKVPKEMKRRRIAE